MKKILTYALLVLAFGGVAAAIYRQSANSAVATPQAAVNLAAADYVTVTYFTSNVRCASCLKIEELTLRSVEGGFAKELEEGKLVYRMINVDEPENRHFVTDYQLVSKTVVVAEVINGVETDWINVQEVWTLLRNEAEFVAHVRQIVRGFL